MDEIDGNSQNNMISNLPLLFANGYPTSLEKITEKQLENFIPFMVHCSLGQINNIQSNSNSCNEPEWWPEDVQFSIPLSKPRNFQGNWREKMKEIVLICYKFHKSAFLLRFCNDLAQYEPATLRFINNYNSTTSLFERRNNKLLVTFRNENLSYDQPQRNRKCLLIKKSRNNRNGDNVGDTDDRSSSHQQQLMVEPALFDIYLCDYCDGEFYSFEAIKEHEKTCKADDDDNDDDVIICDSPTPEKIERNTERRDDELREAFLLNFQLQKCKNDSDKNCIDIKDSNVSTNKLKSSSSINSSSKPGKSHEKEIENSPIEKLKKLPRRNRGFYTWSRYPTIPISSPAGQLLIKSSKTIMTEDYLYERLDRMERFCHAPILAPCVNRPKFLDKKFISSNVQCTYKRSIMENNNGDNYKSIRTYIFPKKNYRSKYYKKSFLFLNSLLLKRCRPISIRLKKYTEEQLRQQIEKRKRDIIMKRRMQEKANCSRREIIVETIDLCSSDDEEENVNLTNKYVRTTPLQTASTQQCSLNRLSNSSSSSSSSSSSLLSSSIRNSSSTLSNFYKNNGNVGINIINRINHNNNNNNNNNNQNRYNNLSFTKRTTANINHDEITNNKNVNKFEGNFLLSQSPKPLQPSVLLFSNYNSHNHNNSHLNTFSNTMNLNHQQLQQLQQQQQQQQLLQQQQLQQQLLQEQQQQMSSSSTSSSSSSSSPLPLSPIPATVTNNRSQILNFHQLYHQNQENLENNSDDVILLPATSNSNISSNTNNNNVSNNRIDRNNSRILQFVSSYRESHPEVSIRKINNSPTRTISIDLTL